MLNSNERMGFIIEYMSSYDEKIKMANKNGLFDAAKIGNFCVNLRLRYVMYGSDRSLVI